ncbi:hypothetical protein E2C01_029175 [Portunus trituberculatus]|uniref:Uncharacterized protein n=1 Tax=Portunus trituberculatus TaxID=210409 RepID=A0A5B7EMN0_PORTR|nr:hypothetical protein [Portunus trituberculatus]
MDTSATLGGMTPLLALVIDNGIKVRHAKSTLAVTPLCLHSLAACYNLCFHLASFITTIPKVPKEIGKRKKVILTIQKKLGDIGQAEGESIGNVHRHEYGIGNATVTDIKKAGPQLRQFT